MTGRADDQGRLPFIEAPVEAPVEVPAEQPGGRVVRVLPDVAAIDRTFDYLVPEAWEEDGRADLVRPGSQVRVVLGGRRVGGWVVDVDVEPPDGVPLRPLAHVGGLGPSPEVIDLARWAAHRWAGRTANLLTTASPPNRVRVLPPPSSTEPVPKGPDRWAEGAFASPVSVLRLPPNADPLPLVLAGARRGDTLVVAPTLDAVGRLAVRLRRTGVPVSVLPREWAQAASGGVVLGARAAALAPVRDLAAAIVLDEHDESLREERAPTWNARDLVLGLVPVLRSVGAGVGGPVVCVLNRRGRSRLLACDGCGELARCEEHRVPLVQAEEGALDCPVDGVRRPMVCDACGGLRFRNLRAGVARVREELEALAARPVCEVDAETPAAEVAAADVLVGTEAVLHRVDRASQVVFLDVDQELLAPRMRAAEQAMALLVRAARLVGPRSRGGRLVVQTRQPGHEVLQAVLHADPGRLVEAEAARRRLLGLPPYAALAQVSGAAAAEFVDRLGAPEGVDVLGPRDGAWLVRADGPEALADALASVERPAGRLRIEVDPARA